MLNKIFNTKNFYHKLSFTSVLVLIVGLGAVYLVASHADAPTLSNQVQAQPECNAAPIGYASCASLLRTDSVSTNVKPTKLTAGATASDTIGDGGGYDPAELRAAYNVTNEASSGGYGKVVAIVDAYDDPTAESDLGTYRSFWGLPACTTADGCFHKVNEAGIATDYPAPNSSWEGEISLDLDMVSAICPNCQIVLVEATTNSWSDFAQSENTAAMFGPVAISNSYSGSEGLPGSQYYNSVEANSYNHAGIAVLAATGDAGYNTGGSGQPTGEGVAFPAVLPFVTAVGGTSLYQNATASTRMATETAWSGAGSGCSTTQAKPSWQTDTGCTNKTIADISAVADPQTPVWVVEGNQWYFYGGTSVATPILSSIYAIGNQSYNYSSSTPYTNSTLYNDITSGSNSSTGCSVSYLCTAGVGYDGPTGVGTPNGVASMDLASPADSPTVNITSPIGSSDETSTFTISGTANDGASTVQSVSISVDGGSFNTISGTSSWSDTLNASTYSIGLHNVTVKATNAAGNSSIASEGLYFGNFSPPPAPTGFSGSPSGPQSIKLTWDSGGSSVASYEIFKSQSTVTVSASTTTYSDTGLMPNQTYNYCLMAIGTNGFASSQTCINVPLPAIPGNLPTAPVLTLNQVTSTSATLSWTSSKSTIGIYEYDLSTGGKGGDNLVNGTSLDLAGLTPGATYAFNVYAIDLNENYSSASNTVNVTLPALNAKPTPIVPPSSLTAQAQSYSQVNLTWKAASGGVVGINYYEVFRDNTYLGKVTASSAVKGILSYSDGTAKTLTKYSYYVKAFDYALNPSAASNTVSITTPAEYKVSVLKGTIKNSSTKKVLGGVSVSVTASNKEVYTATSNSLGVYQISNVPSGTVKVVFKHSGYKTKTVTMTLGAVYTKTYNVALVKA